MKSKDKNELHAKSIKELERMANETQNTLVELKLDKAQNKLKNTTMLSNKRKEIAQLLTIMRAKKLSETKIEKNNKSK